MSNEQNYVLFRQFSELTEAQAMKEFLAEGGIESQLEYNTPPFDITFAGNLQQEIQILLRPQDFEGAKLLLKEEAGKEIANISEDYYLFEFSEEELKEILQKPDEWSVFDYELAQRILSERGEEIGETYLENLKEERIAELSKPETSPGIWIFLGYFFALTSGLLGMVVGYYLWKLKKTLPNGDKVLAYSARDRKHGKQIFIIGLVLSSVFILFTIISTLIGLTLNGLLT